MGNLTPILIYNDFAHIFNNKKLRKEICEELYYALCDSRQKNINISDNGHMKSLGYGHADSPRVIVIYGNTWMDIEKLKDRNDDVYKQYLKDCLEVLKEKTKRFEDKIKEVESGI
jgi:hypothetical protein